ncbi:WG repeat-containing protein [Xanthomonas sp. XNM01]|uniref:WG repeat-containing protein n=1 Tax=Xanthomonas sp. XNM01 TaxID=2769289 RepID=UPI00177D02B1|nr:WG repeat-containing protein [Xanthomonas sp. XNM01]MBD9370034.1 WG repeat-containing protein [Xanthomonas sp. XNM01]
MSLFKRVVVSGLFLAAGGAWASDDACSVREYGMTYYTELAGQHGRCIGRLSEGLATIKLDGLEGAIDADGRMVVPPRFSWLRPFSQGLAAASDPGTGKTGFIDRTGAWVIAPQFDSADHFSAGGTAVVRLAGYVQALIDRQGTVLRRMPPDVEIEPGYGVDPFPAGVARAVFKRPPVLVHLDGRQLAPPTDIQVRAWEPQIGRFVAQVPGGGMGVLDSELRWVAEPGLQRIPPFAGDRAAATLASGRMVLIDRDGRRQGSADHAQLVAAAPGLWLASDGHGTPAMLIDDHARVLDADVAGALDAPFGDWFVHRQGERGLVLRAGDGRVVRHLLPAPPRAITVRPRVLEVELEEVDGQLATQLFALDGRALLPPRPDDGGDGWSIMTFWKAPADQAAPGPLATIRSYRDNRHHGIGILTASGRLLFDPAWADFSGNDRFDGDGPLIVRTTAHRHGAIDGEGRWLVQPDLVELGGFRAGWARARDADGRLLLIDASGGRRVVPRFGNGVPDADGLYAIEDDRRRPQLLELATGTVLFEGRFDAMLPYRGGLAPAQRGDVWGLVDRSGAWRVEPTYRLIEPFGPRFWRARYASLVPGASRTLLLGPDGQPLQAEPWLSIYSSRRSHPDFLEQPWLDALTSDLDVQTAPLVLADGTPVTGEMVGGVSPLGGGWMRLEFAALSGYVDPQGEWVIPPMFSSAEQFVAGPDVARAYADGSVHLIDLQGRTVFDPQGMHVGDVSPDGLFYQHDTAAGLTHVRALGEPQPRFSLPGTRYGAILDELYVHDDEDGSAIYDARGKRLAAGLPGRMSTFAEGRALLRAAEGEKLFRYVDRRGRRALRGDFIYATVFHAGRAVVMDTDGYRMIDGDGRTVVRVGSECGREVLVDATGTRTWPERLEACVE